MPGVVAIAPAGLTTTVELAVDATSVLPLGGLSTTAAGRRTVKGAAVASPGGLYATVAGGSSVFGVVTVALGGLSLTGVSGAQRWAVKVPPGQGSRWELLVAETIGGQVVAELPFTGLSWATRLNAIGTLSATVPVEQNVTGLGPWDDLQKSQSAIRSPSRLTTSSISPPRTHPCSP